MSEISTQSLRVWLLRFSYKNKTVLGRFRFPSKDAEQDDRHKRRDEQEYAAENRKNQ